MSGLNLSDILQKRITGNPGETEKGRRSGDDPVVILPTDIDKIAELEKTIADLKNPNDDDTMSEEERNEKLQEAISKKAIAEEKKEEALEKSNAIDTTDETKRTAEI